MADSGGKAWGWDELVVQVAQPTGDQVSPVSVCPIHRHSFQTRVGDDNFSKNILLEKITPG